MNKFYRDKKALVHWSAARNEERHRPTDKPRIQRRLCSPTGLNSISLVRAPEELSGQLRPMPWRVRAPEGTFRTGVFDALVGARVGRFLGGEPICRRPVLPGPVPPRRPAVRRPVPTCP